MLLDPLEEQSHLPAAPVDLRNRKRGQDEGSGPRDASSAAGATARASSRRLWGAATGGRTGIPAAAENDCNLAALAELSFAEAEANHLRDFVFLEIGDVGVGGSIVIDRALYRGHDFALSAEFGHMVVESDGLNCSCGRRRCWELFVCNRATLSRYQPDLEFSAESFDRFLESLNSREADSVAAIGETARYLSIGVSNIAFALNPEVIIMAGRLTQAWRSIEPLMLRELDSTKLRVTVQTARHNAEELFLHGAARLALNQVFGHRAVGW